MVGRQIGVAEVEDDDDAVAAAAVPRASSAVSSQSSNWPSPRAQRIAAVGAAAGWESSACSRSGLVGAEFYAFDIAREWSG
jgi:hypothetical protein